jgi:hypothetical protein
MLMFCTFQLSFDEDIVAFLVWQLFWLLFGYFFKFGRIFFPSLLITLLMIDNGL